MIYLLSTDLPRILKKHGAADTDVALAEDGTIREAAACLAEELGYVDSVVPPNLAIQLVKAADRMRTFFGAESDPLSLGWDDVEETADNVLSAILRNEYVATKMPEEHVAMRALDIAEKYITHKQHRRSKRV